MTTRYQVGTYGAGGEWHPVTEYTETYATIEEAELARDVIAGDSDDRDAAKAELKIREVG